MFHRYVQSATPWRDRHGSASASRDNVKLALEVQRPLTNCRRRASQKPSDELYKNFKASFPHLNQGVIGTSAAEAGVATLTDALDVAVNSQYAPPEVSLKPYLLDNRSPSLSPLDDMAQTITNMLVRPGDPHAHDIKDGDTTPRGSNEPWHFGTSGLTPSLMDPTSQSFNMFANQMPGYYTPTPGGTSTLYHNQAGDLHTPGIGGGLGTPLSLPTSEGALHAGHQATAFHGFHNHMSQHVHPQAFQNVDPFQMHHPTSFPPHQFTHQPSFEHLDGPVGESPIDDLGMDVHMHPHSHSPHVPFHSQTLHNAMKPPHVHPSAEKFRYHVTLNAPTAMIKHADEIPVTYLNKGQAYTLNVVDTLSKQHSAPMRYRTYVRVSFEDEQQRLRPAACWQLWKEGRGTNEAHQRGGRLQAVEYVESGQIGSAEDPSKPRIELEKASHDGFCVQWSPPAGALECPISVRFNFLSTDFSHSKGVKGIPVRLCTKTEAIGEISPPQPQNSEVCYCKVKLFRDHGAERKLSNDIAHVKKTIDKLNQQIAQIESGMKDLGKRKRSGSMAKLNGLEHRPGKIPKHRRTWSMSSVTSTSGRGSAEDELHVKLMTLQDMFTSTRPASVLYLRGAEEDDPDLHPVKMLGEPPELQRMDSTDTTAWDERQSSQAGGPESSLTSRSPSANSMSGSHRESKIQQPTPFPGASRSNSNEWQAQTLTAPADIELTPPTRLQPSASTPEIMPIKVQTRSPNTGTTSGWIEALDVDQTYQPPPERPAKPVACFYIQPRVAGRAPSDNFYRAIYLFRRTLKDFVNAAAMKCNIEPTQILRTVRISREGLHILFDDDCILELMEGQDMTAEFSELQADSPVRNSREWDAGSPGVQCDGDVSAIETVNSTGYELRLLF